MPDPCPHCRTDLGGSGSITRRIALSSPTPGAFQWQCPSCSHRWTEPGRSPRSQPGRFPRSEPGRSPRSEPGRFPRP